MRLYAQGQTLDTGAQKNKSHDQKKRRTEGLDKKYAGACKRGHGSGFRVSLLANCRISVWAPNQRHPTAAAALRACHRATSPAHESRRPVGPHNCVDAQPPNDTMGNGGHEVGARAGHLGQGSRHWEVGKLGSWEPLNPSMAHPPPPLLEPPANIHPARSLPASSIFTPRIYLAAVAPRTTEAILPLDTVVSSNPAPRHPSAQTQVTHITKASSHRISLLSNSPPSHQVK